MLLNLQDEIGGLEETLEKLDEGGYDTLVASCRYERQHTMRVPLLRQLEKKLLKYGGLFS